MGSTSEVDLINISTFAERVVRLPTYARPPRYLIEKMKHCRAQPLGPYRRDHCRPSHLARRFAHQPRQYPASTVQISVPRRPLPCPHRTKGNTPKYGLIYHSSFIGRAGSKHKGRISRFLANKCSIACRIDCFSDVPTNKFGGSSRAQVEERLNFLRPRTRPELGRHPEGLTAIAADLETTRTMTTRSDVDDVEISEGCQAG
jgi:nucleolar protein 56